MHINIIQRTTESIAETEAFRWMWGEARRRGLDTTTLVTRDTLLNADSCDKLRSWVGEHPSDELGISLHDFASEAFRSKYRTNEAAFWLLPRTVRVDFLAEVMALFHERFGRLPLSVGSYVLDAWTLKHIETVHPHIRIAVTNCFEEGVNMFRGNFHTWYLFSDGGPWGPFWPSRDNALAPALDRDDSVDIVAIPHLNRDMGMAISSRDDLFASHPLNLFRAKINDDGECPYHFRALEQWVEQTALNGWSYYNIFVGASWLTPGHWAVPDLTAGKGLYAATLDAFAQLQSEGRATVCTMAACGEDFRKSVPPGEAQICHWKDVLHKNAKREMVWVVNSHYRLTLDLNLGGTMVDIRAYDGRVDGDMGPECAVMVNGSYPFLISSEHRGGFWNTGQAGFLIVDGKKIALWEQNRVAADVRRLGAGEWVIEAAPVVADWDGGSAKVVSRWFCNNTGSIRIEREIVEISGHHEQLGICEWFGGCFGTNEYPVDLRGTVLTTEDRAGQRLDTLKFDYASGDLTREGVHRITAHVPRARVSVSLSGRENLSKGRIREGWLFSPYYGLELTQSASLGVPVSSLLELRTIQLP